ncbi:MAG: hypothetical protein U0936_25040 [Planctomycetaceae bacterium]
MIAPSEQTSCEGVPELEIRPADYTALARYGRVPQVARFSGFGPTVDRGTQIVVSTDRGEEIAEVLQATRNLKPETPDGMTGEVVRVATDVDLATSAKNEQMMEAAFPGWIERCAKWKLQLELIDLEMTLDSRLILYVLNDRGAETTRMALLAAAAGLGIVHVQPVSAEGVVQASGGGGCGSCSNH